MNVDNKYNIIYADPPWSYGSSINKNYHVTGQYPTMTDKQLRDLPIGDIADDQCLLYMWATGPSLNTQIPIGESWGFKYKQVAFVWDKVNGIPGCYSFTQTEFLLVFRKGKMLEKTSMKGIHQLYKEKKTKHSKKPDYFRDVLMQLYPSASKIELFARQQTPGWDVWGNEV